MAPNLQSDIDLAVQPLEPMDQPITLLDGKLFVHDLPFLTDVPPTVVASPFSTVCNSKVADRTGCFLGFDTETSKSRHVASLGKLKDIRFCSIFRFKVWWTTHWVGDKGSDMETETQFLLLDTPAKAASQNLAPHPYVLLLPILEGPFRASLQPGDDDNVDVCVESCDDGVQGSSFRSVVYVHAGSDPYDLMKDAMRALRAHLGTFRLLEEKTPPGIVEKFGWCTWDAFYLTVRPEGVWEGVQGLVDGGCPPGLVLIDDGWQSISHDDDPSKEAMALTVAGEQMPCRLTGFDENYKFKNYVGGTLPHKSTDEDEEDQNGPSGDVGMGAFVRDLKTEFHNLDYVYVWHAFCGYWGGLRPGSTKLPATVVTPRLSPGLQSTMEDLAVDKIVNNGVGLVPPDRAAELYEAMHSYLASLGIDGVKVDVIHVLELLSEGFGGRVDLAKAYFNGLSASVRKYFKGNGVIASMEHCNDFVYLGTKQITLGRVGDDFWPCSDPNDPNGLDLNDTYWLQGCHMVHCAYNSLWMGQVMQPDWDMFQTTHPCAAFHAASRAISGGPIYVSDKVGQHDFELLRRLVVPDGSILRCRHYALPTRDCLFQDPLHNGQTLLKIWNLNKYSGVVGAFNCQGGGWHKEERTNKCAAEFSKRVYSTVSAKDVEWYQVLEPALSVEGVDQFAVYMFKAQKFLMIGPGDEVGVELDPFTFELFTIVPVRRMPRGVRFAALGLVNMLNTGGAVERVRLGGAAARVDVKGCGEMWAYASRKPKECKLNGKETDFVYRSEDGTLRIEVPWIGGPTSVIEYIF
uniref:galactinol--sucrose galactosyltransferase n=1 Tax=Araucaria cunninghamii TaxID=56994 RepID=A0A0D6QS51_ARACU